nr:MAG TPA: hypothetical protein [Caudoviricetes sp.]
MIKCEYFDTRSDGVILVKTYSDSNKYILQNETNNEYDIAIDVGFKKNNTYKPNYFTYTETDKIIEEVKEDE